MLLQGKANCNKKLLFGLLFTLIFVLLTIALQAQISTKTFKLFTLPSGATTTDSIMVWQSSDSTMQIANHKVYDSLYWGLIGNGGTIAGTSFIGTTDSVDWLAKTNNTERMRITAAGNVGINTVTSPYTMLDVTGTPANALKTDGIKAPLITLAQLNVKTGYGINQTGTLVYVTDTLGGSTVAATSNITTIGYYYFDGTTWHPFPKPTGSVIFSASLGNGSTSSGATQTVAANAYTVVVLANVLVNIGGGSWNPTNNTYTVPVSGTYLLKSTVRIADFTTVSRDVFQCIGTTLGDQPYGVWTQNSVTVPNNSVYNRWTDLYMRIAYLNKGDVIQLFTYSNGTTMGIAQASMDILFLTQNGTATNTN